MAWVETSPGIWAWEGSPELPGPDLTPEHVAAYLGRAGDPQTVALAVEHLPVVCSLVRSRTRGRGFSVDGTMRDDLRAVALAATARLVTNPEQVESYQAGDYSERPARFQGFNLVEQMVLDRYRVKAM